MDLLEAKQYLNSKGFILEDTTTNTKSLVAKFWDLRKKGETLSKEDAKQLLNADDFKEVVNPKYQNFIKSSLNKLLSGETSKEPKKEKSNEVKPFETVDYSKSEYKVFGYELSPEYRYGFYKEVRENANKLVEYSKNANEALEFLNKFDLEDSEQMSHCLNRFSIEKDPTKLWADDLLYLCKGSMKNTDDEEKLKETIKKYRIDPERIDDYYKELASKIEQIGFTPLKFGHEKTYNGKVPTEIYFTCDYNGFNMYFQLFHGYPCFYVDSYVKGKLNFDYERSKDFYDNTGCDLVWHNPRGSSDTRNSVKVPKLTIENLKIIKDYIDKEGQNIVNDSKKKADDYQKWYNSLSDIGRDIHDYYTRHPNGNWSGD